MEPNVNYLKLISNCFDKLHEQLTVLRANIEKLDDPEAQELLKKLELGFLPNLRSLRRCLDIPYDWHERKEEGPKND